jgi:hypothetical protein
MTETPKALYTECGAALEDGFIGYSSSIMWHDEDPEGLRRVFPFVLGVGHFIISNPASTPWVRSRRARTCPDRGTLVVPP